MIRFYCINCGHALQAEDRKAGATVSCPGCTGRVQIPGEPVALTVEPDDLFFKEIPEPSAALPNVFRPNDPPQHPTQPSLGRRTAKAAAALPAIIAGGLAWLIFIAVALVLLVVFPIPTLVIVAIVALLRVAFSSKI